MPGILRWWWFRMFRALAKYAKETEYLPAALAAAAGGRGGGRTPILQGAAHRILKPAKIATQRKAEARDLGGMRE